MKTVKDIVTSREAIITLGLYIIAIAISHHTYVTLEGIVVGIFIARGYSYHKKTFNKHLYGEEDA